jgi:2-polyprenyl-3-methyl-5-hydroxy-6-metoxy-1,4-benzoquinol methylase
MGFVAPTPKWDEVQSFYPSDYRPYQLNLDMVKREARSLKYKIARLRYVGLMHPTFKNYVISALAAFVELCSGRIITYTLGIPLNLQRGAHIMDLGCGSGNWLLAMKKLGYTNLEGYDIDANKSCISTLTTEGIKITSGRFLENNYSHSSYDLIRLEHVVEHLPHPLPILSKIAQLLNKNGYLVMNLPSIQTLFFSGCSKEQIMDKAKNWYNLQIPKHLYFHTKLSVFNYLNNAGFDIIGLRLYGVPNVLGASINNVLKGTINIPAFLVNGLGPFYTLVSAVANKGDSITVIAKVKS